ncbi:MAG: ribonuclease P protein component [Oscillospiraceae bacterium]|nr:ribonuclease P protein component [Oscillospiraceae bacterium]
MLFTQMLNRNADFQRLYRSGAFCSLGGALIYVRPNGLSTNRLGITAGKKVGNAVKRNRAKRIIRAAYSACELMLPVGIDIVFVARYTLPGQSALVLTDAFRRRGVPHCQDVLSGKIQCVPNQKSKPHQKKQSAGVSK